MITLGIRVRLLFGGGPNLHRNERKEPLFKENVYGMIYKVILKTMWIEATTVVYNIQNFISTPYGRRDVTFLGFFLC